MTTQWIPITDAYNKVSEDLTFPSSYKNTILNWIGECTETMRISKTLVLQNEKTKVTDYKVMLPCGAVNIIAVFRNGQRLHHTNSITGRLKNIDRNINHSSLNVWQTVIPLATVLSESTPLPLPLYIQALQQLKSYTLTDENCFGVDYYKQNGNCLQFNFENSEEVEIFYEGVFKTEDDVILIPDNIFYLEAIVYWVEHKLIRRGIIKETNVNRDSFEKYKDYKNKAINSISFPSPEKMQGIADKLGLFSYDLYSDGTL